MSDRVTAEEYRVIEFTAPVRIESEMNRREHWAKRKKRFDGQRLAVYVSALPEYHRCGFNLPFQGVPLPSVVTLTRIGPRKLDSDNLAGGFKAVRDEIARIIGIDDGDERIEWRYEQEKGRAKEYAIRVRIES